LHARRVLPSAVFFRNGTPTPPGMVRDCCIYIFLQLFIMLPPPLHTFLPNVILQK
jgi:hypothetical protein